VGLICLDIADIVCYSHNKHEDISYLLALVCYNTWASNNEYKLGSGWI